MVVFCFGSSLLWVHLRNEDILQDEIIEEWWHIGAFLAALAPPVDQSSSVNQERTVRKHSRGEKYLSSAFKKLLEVPLTYLFSGSSSRSALRSGISVIILYYLQQQKPQRLASQWLLSYSCVTRLLWEPSPRPAYCNPHACAVSPRLTVMCTQQLSVRSNHLTTSCSNCCFFFYCFNYRSSLLCLDS